MISALPTLTSKPGLDDDALAGQARHDRAAFAELYHRHFDRVYRYHLAHTGAREDAQDLTAQTFLAALESITRYRASGSFAAWLLGIARHKVAQHYRSRKPSVPLEAALDLADPGPSPESAVTRRFRQAQIARLLAGLVPERAEAIRLCIFSDLTAPQAALVMGKSAAAVKMLVHRGLKDLREKSSLSMGEELLSLKEEL